MSEEFIQFYFPCNICLVQAACKDRENVKERVKGINNQVPSLGIPNFEEGKSYHKGLLECWANVGRDIMDRLSRSELNDGSQTTRDQIPTQYVHVMIDIAEILCYMINSTSWSEGKLFDFDRDEIKRKLSHLKRWI